MALSIYMLLLWILLIIEAKSFHSIFTIPSGHGPHTQAVIVLAAPVSNTIQYSVTGAQADNSVSDFALVQQSKPDPSTVTLPDLTLTNSLSVLGDTLIGKTSIAGGLTIDGALSLSAHGIQSFGDTLTLEQNKLAPIDFMDGALRINTDGTVLVGNQNVSGVLGVTDISPLKPDITVDLSRTGSGSSFGAFLIKGSNGSFAALDSSGSAHFSGNVDASGTGTFARITSPYISTTKLSLSSENEAGSVGQGTIPAGYSAMKILTNAAGKNSRIFVTPVSVSTLPISVTHLSPASAIVGGSFTVETSAPVPHDVDFNWFIVN